ncbi:hypothetical protein DM860_006077 [Cuscuta australis]|uniref:Uncharacterized protein n=1 Tax=Cuscuta australis TaxID=267555 RepID=A0A328DPK5_9ASTE|nr:hypothetical protein DM860_006077 [Cuscuta australis]
MESTRSEKAECAETETSGKFVYGNRLVTKCGNQGRRFRVPTKYNRSETGSDLVKISRLKLPTSQTGNER